MRRCARILCLGAIVALGQNALAMKNRSKNFSQPCEAVWSAAVNVVKGKEYRIISISKEEQIISVSVGGAWTGERVISLSLSPGSERGCLATVQSRFSGLAHSDGPDLLARINVELVGQEVDRDSKAFQNYKECVENGYSSNEKCEAKLEKDIEKSRAKNSSSADPGTSKWWNVTQATDGSKNKP